MKMRRKLSIYIFVIICNLLATSFKIVNAIQCFECTSESEAGKNCVSLRYNENEKLPVKSCANDVKSCFTEIQGGKIIRGCLASDRSNNLSDQWTKRDSSLLKTCSTPMCNNDEIKAEFCISCDSKENPNCKNNITSELRTKCPFSPQLMGCYHFEKDDFVKRGCLSEIESESDRKTCESNSDNCKHCMGSYCNSRKNGFQRCLFTNSSNLQATDASTLNSKVCTNYRSTCYTLVSNDIIKRGCIADESNMDSICENENICEKCSSNNCNQKRIQVEMCVICDSKVNRNCRRDPSDLMWDQCPLESIRPLGCFMYENNKHVQRGCMSAQNQNFRDVCLLSGDTCKYCIGDFCNKKPHFTTCRNCDSDKDGQDENCARWPWKTNSKICQQYHTDCYTHVNENGTVVRGCFDEFESDKRNCDDNNTCVRCSDGEYVCNDNAIKQESCISCDSETDIDCKTNAIYSKSEVCPRKTINPLGCFHFINSTSSHTKRDCVSKLSDENRRYALEKVSEWKFCVGKENCNSKDRFTRCIFCNSSSDSNCISNPSQSNTKVCDKYDDVCYSFIDGSEVSRGCLSDLESNLIDKCRSSPGKCEACTNYEDGVCNNEPFSSSTCIECDSDTEQKCRYQPELLTQKLCSTISSNGRDSGCFLAFDETQNRLERGCVSDLNPQRKQFCLSNTDECKVCDGNNCNKKIEFQKCFSCTSINNSDCVQNAPFDVTVTCKNYMDKCLTGIDRNGILIRQCASDENIKSFNQSDLCEDNVCNGKIFPENRIQCFQCDGDEKCSQLRTNNDIPLEVKPCTLFNQHDQCFMYLNADNKIFRGCLTDPSDSRLLCERNNDSCEICDETGCNGRVAVTEPELACHQCKDGTKCGYGQVQNDTIIKCKTPANMFGTKESCFTRVHTDGVVERGCILDINQENVDWCRDTEDCVECQGHGCNDENIYFSNCLQCDSANDKNCQKPPTNSSEFHVTCFSTLGNNSSHFKPYTFSKRGCYINYGDGALKRGCVSDLTDKQQKDCEDSKDCHICEDEYCNTQSAANQIFLSTALVSFIILLTQIFP